MILRTAFVLLFAFRTASAQVVLTEVMFDADTLESYNEFVEIYNLNSFVIDLNGWQVGDSAEQDLITNAGNGLQLQPNQYGIILDPGYFANSTSYDSLIPPGALIITIDDGSFGSFGFSNSQPEWVLLVNASGDTIQKYQYSIGNTPGHSDEKIILNDDNSDQNWGNSIGLKGTPGFKNSLSPKDIDLAIAEFRFLDNNFVVGSAAAFEVIAKNLGQQTINGFQFQKFYDLNLNQQPDSNEILETVSIPSQLTAGDSMIVEDEFEDIPAGNVSFGVGIIDHNDEDLSNNYMTQAAYVSDPLNQKIIINEIMAAPQTGKEEWVELFNPGLSEINLREIYFADAVDTVQVSKADLILQPQGYAVICGDSAAAFQYNILWNKLQVIGSFPTLNNSFDDLKLLNKFNFVYDRVSYTDGWYGRDVGSGTSLEKINPNLNGQISENWAASVDISGSTPVGENSIFAAILPSNAQLQIHPNPFSPDGDGFEDVAIIQVKIPVETAFINIRIYDTRGRLIRFLADSIPAGHESNFVWDGGDDNGRIARIGAYICFVEALNSNKRVSRQLKSTIILVKQ